MENLFALKKSAMFDSIIALDIETSSRGEVLDIGIYDGLDFRVFQQWEAFFNHLFSRQGKYRIIAHNGFGFDYITMLQYLLEHFDRHGITAEQIKIFSSESVYVGIVIYNGSNTYSFLDTMRFFVGQSLNSVARDFLAMQKTEVSNGYINRMEEYKAKYRTKYYEYLKRDCVLLYDVYCRFRERVNMIQPIGELGFTSGSTALKCFRRHMSTDNYFIWGSDVEYDVFADHAMRGGLTLCIGDGDLQNGSYQATRSYDVINMYPAIMRRIPVPTSPLKYTRQFNARKPGWYLCEYEQREGRVPFLYDIESNDIAWKGTGVLTDLEITFLRQFGGKVKIIDGLIYDDYVLPFHGYVDKQLEFRKKAKEEGRSAESATLKVLLNSLYGKFAQKRTREMLAITSDHDWYESRLAAQLASRGETKILEYYYSDKVILYGVESESTTFSNRFIGAMITARARLKLGMLLNTVPAIYCDTDSIFTQSILPDCFIGTKPGQFELKQDATELILCGKKAYLHGDEAHWKGIPRKLLTRADYQQVQAGAILPVSYRTPTAMITALKNDIKNPNEFTNKIRRIRRAKTLKEQGILRDDASFFQVRKVRDFLQNFVD